MVKTLNSSIDVMQKMHGSQSNNLTLADVFFADQINERIAARYGAQGQLAGFQNVKTTDRNNYIMQDTGNALDIATKSSRNLFVVKKDDHVGYVQGGSFRINKEGTLVSDQDFRIQGARIGSNGAIPIDAPVNTQDITIGERITKAVATTEVNFEAKLNAQSTVLVGAGDVFKPNNFGNNKGLKRDSIILPDSNSAIGSIQEGDTFSIRSEAIEQTDVKFQYGGFTSSTKIDSTNKMFGSNGVNSDFTINTVNVGDDDVNAGKVLRTGEALKVTVAGEETILKAEKNAQTGQSFSSLSSLVTALNRIPGLHAEVRDGRLVAAPQDGNAEVKFENMGGNKILEVAGLKNIANNTEDNIKRFNTMAGLQRAINEQTPFTGVKAEFVDASKKNVSTKDSDIGLRVTSALATESFYLENVRAMGKHDIYQVKMGDGTYDHSANIKISSPMHGLVSGDLVNIEGLAALQPDGANATIPDGHYRVEKVNDDEFIINGMAPNNTNQYLIQDGATNNLPIKRDITRDGLANAAWTKMPGQKYDVQERGTVINVAAGGDIMINMPAAHGLVADDMVYISGMGAFLQGAEHVAVPDGVYKVKNPGGGGGNDFQITPAYNNAGAPAGAVAAQFPAVAGSKGGFKVQKLGALTGGALIAGINFNQTVITTVVGTKNIILHAPNNNYNVNDYISFEGFTGNTINALTISNNVNYKIISKNGDEITVEIEDSPAVAVAGPGISYAENANAANDFIPQAFRINHKDMFLKDMNVTERNKSKLDATYDPGDARKNLSSASHDNTFSAAIEVINSNGVRAKLLLTASKLGNHEWVAEWTVPQDMRDLIETEGNNGMIANGKINIIEAGAAAEADFSLTALVINWKDGSEQSAINVDLSKVTSYATGSDSVNDSRVTKNEQNGRVAGMFENFRIDEDGHVYAIFDNGHEELQFALLSATINGEVNAMARDSMGLLQATVDSGPVVLQKFDLGEIATSSMKIVDVDQAAALARIQELNLNVQAQAKARALTLDEEKTLMNEIRT